MHTYNVKGRWYESSKYIYLCICEYLVWVIISSSLGIRSFTWLVWLMSVENFIRRVQQLLLQDNNSCLMFSYTCNWFSFLNFKCISISIISTQIYIHMLRSLEYYASRKPRYLVPSHSAISTLRSTASYSTQYSAVQWCPRNSYAAAYSLLQTWRFINAWLNFANFNLQFASNGKSFIIESEANV